MARTASYYRMVSELASVAGIPTPDGKRPMGTENPYADIQFGGLQAHQTLPRERNPRSVGEAHAPQAPRSLQCETTHLHGCAPCIAPVPFSPPAFLGRQRNQKVESKWAKLRAYLLLIASSFFSPARKMVNRTPIGRGYRLWKLFRAIMEQGR